MEFLREMTVPLPRSQVFAFFAEAGNLERLTPPELKFRILTPTPIAMRPGALIDYALSLFGVRFSWRSEITVWEPETRFVDIQVRGPYAEWVHTHTFEDVPGGTRIRDHVRYRLPLAPLGNIALPVVRVQLRRIFDYREAVTRRLMAE